MKFLLINFVSLVTFFLQANAFESQSRPMKSSYILDDQGNANFILCYNWSCSDRKQLSFKREFLENLSKQVSGCSISAETELLSIRNAIALMERSVLKQVPVLKNDLAGNFIDWDHQGRMDCVDNSTNTNNMVHILNQYTTFKYWKIKKPLGTYLGFLSPHWTVNLETKDSIFINKYYPQVRNKKRNKESMTWALDSWATTFACKPALIEINDWKKNFRELLWAKPYGNFYHNNFNCVPLKKSPRC